MLHDENLEMLPSEVARLAEWVGEVWTARFGVTALCGYIGLLDHVSMFDDGRRGGWSCVAVECVFQWYRSTHEVRLLVLDGPRHRRSGF